MSSHLKLNLNDVADLAPKFGMGEMGEARFARAALGAQRIGMAMYRMNPGRRVGFGHRHVESEEIYVVLSGGGRFRVDDEIMDVAEHDVVYCPPEGMREWEAGPDGLELLAFGAHSDAESPDMQPGWWVD